LPAQQPATAPAEQRPDAAEATAPAEPTQVSADELPRALFGYDRSTIVELLDTMSERIRSLIQERTDREHRIEELEREVQQNQETERLIGETLVSARHEANTIREETRRSAETTLRSVREHAHELEKKAERAAAARASEVLLSAQREKQQLLDAARREREELLERAQQERQEILEEAGRARAFIEETHEQLSDFLMAAVKWYERVKPIAEPKPEPEPEPEPAPAPAQPQESAPPPAPEPAPAPEAPIPANDRSSIPAA